jgi:hypothetical protein
MRSSTEYARKNARVQLIRISAGMPRPAQHGEQSLEDTPPRDPFGSNGVAPVTP